MSDDIYKIEINLLDSNNDRHKIEFKNILLENIKDPLEFSTNKNLYMKLSDMYIDRNIIDKVIHGSKENISIDYAKYYANKPKPISIEFFYKIKKFLEGKSTKYGADPILNDIIEEKLSDSDNNARFITFYNLLSVTQSLEENKKNRDIIKTLADTLQSFIKEIINESKDDPNLKIELNEIFGAQKSTSSSSREKKDYELFAGESNNNSFVEKIFKEIRDSKIESYDSGYGYDRRTRGLNNDHTKKELIDKYGIMIFPDKKSKNFNDDDKKAIITFYNIYYILKQFYLKDNTIVSSVFNIVKDPDDDTGISDINQKLKKYYIKNFNFIEKDKSIDRININYSVDNKTIEVYFKAEFVKIYPFPNLKIFFYINDLEKTEKLSRRAEKQRFLPKYIDNNYVNYKKIYYNPRIDHSKIAYKNFMKRANVKNKITNIEEIFFNQEVYNIFHELYEKKFTNEENEDIDTENFIYFLNKLLFKQNSVIEFDKLYSIEDVQLSNGRGNFYSITDNSTTTIKNVANTYKMVNLAVQQLKKLLKDKKDKPDGTDKTDKTANDDKYYIIRPNDDVRLPEVKIYEMYIILSVYQIKDKSKKVTLKRKLIADTCLKRARILDYSFASFLYSNFSLSKNFLYNKLLKKRFDTDSKETKKHNETKKHKEPQKHKETNDTRDTNYMGDVDGVDMNDMGDMDYDMNDMGDMDYGMEYDSFGGKNKTSKTSKTSKTRKNNKKKSALYKKKRPVLTKKKRKYKVKTQKR